MAIDFSQVFQELDDTVSFFENEEEQVIADTLKERIVTRTKDQGVDVNGDAFVGYTPKYVKYFRSKHDLPTDRVDLYAIGDPHLLDSITRMDDHTLFFPAEFIPIARGLQSAREFFAANDEDWQAVADNVAIEYNERNSF